MVKNICTRASKTPHAGSPFFWQRRIAALPGGWVVVSGVLFWSLLGLYCGGSAQAVSAESTPLQQFAKTVEGEPRQPAARLFYRHPLGFDAQTVQTVLL